MAASTARKAPRRPAKARPAHGTCQLTLTINGAVYALRPVPCDPSAARRCWSLRKGDCERYHVSLHPYGAECTCPDFIFNRDGRDPGGCEHIRSLAAVGSLPAPRRAPPEPDWAARARQRWIDHCDAPGLDPDDPAVIDEARVREEAAAYDRIP